MLHNWSQVHQTQQGKTAAKNCLKHFNYGSITEWVEEFYDWYN